MGKQRSKTTRAAVPGVWVRWWPYAFLGALALIVYASALQSGFVTDDKYQLLDNPLVTDWSKLPRIFQLGVWAFADNAPSNYYRPVQMVLYLALHSVFGFNSSLFHLFQFLIHAVNTLLVYNLAKLLLKSPAAALVAGILFAVHPIHTEPVIWIAALPDLVMTLLVLTALRMFIVTAARPDRVTTVKLNAIFFAAMLTKEPSVMLLPLLMGYEFLYLGRSLRELWNNRWLYASMMGTFAVYCAMRVHALGGMAPAQGAHYKLHGTTLVLSVISLLGQYLGKLVVPIHLNYFYSFTATTSMTPQVILSFLAITTVVAGIFFLRRSQPVVAYGLFVILIPLAPALNINGIGENAFTERYLYLPSVGAVIAAAIAWNWLAARQRDLAWGLAALLVAASFCIVIPRNRDWQDDERLYTAAARLEPGSPSVIAQLADIHFQHGDYQRALDDYRNALALWTNRADFPEKEAAYHCNMGTMLATNGHPQEALDQFRQAVRLFYRYPAAHMNLGLALEAAGDIPGAIAEQQIALQLKPDYPEPLTALALIHMKRQEYGEAIDLLRRAITAKPQYLEAYVNLAVCFVDQHQESAAISVLRDGLAASPANPDAYVAHYKLGLLYLQTNAAAAADQELSAALRLKPDFAEARSAFQQARALAARRALAVR